MAFAAARRFEDLVMNRPDEDESPTTPNGRRVLVVDDDQPSADSFSALLRMSGYEVYTRYDGASALVAADELHLDLIILDLGMPVMNGFDACKAIREQSWGKEIAIIALTGWGPESEMPSAEACGFDARVIKPPKLEEFLRLLAELLS